jgi:hypothetical protein
MRSPRHRPAYEASHKNITDTMDEVDVFLRQHRDAIVEF